MIKKKGDREQKLLTILTELVRIPSYGKIDSNHKMIEYLKKQFQNCEETVEITDKNGNTHLLIGVNNKLQDLDNAIVLSGHIDTVRESNGHTCNISVDKDTLKGLGISDMKAFIATIIANLDYLKSLDIPIVISLTSDEETNLLGIEHIIKELNIRNITPGMVVVGEPTNLDYYVSSRGNSIYVSLMNGISCHSGTPELGVNAIELQTEFMAEIIALRQLYENEASVCITHIDGGKSPSNVVPDMSSACFGIRTSNTNVLAEMYNYLQERHKEISKSYGESKLFNVLDIPPFERRDNEFIDRQAELKGKNKVDAKYATEAGYFQRAYPESAILIYGPGQPDKIHESGEYLEPNKLFQYANELNELLSNFLQYKKTDHKKLVHEKK